MNNVLPCVGFELQYSPLDRDCFENLAQSLHNKAHEFIFDVVQQVKPGQSMLMVFSNKQGPTQLLLAEVNDCMKLGNQHYRITLITRADARVLMDNADSICLPISKGISTAQELNLVCPSCNNKTQFHYVANQEGDWESGILPIYTCGFCGTSRAMIGLVNGKD